MVVAPRRCRSRPLPLLNLDPDLGAALDREEFEEAGHELRAHVARVPIGPWQPQLDGGRSTLGLLVVGGLLIRETRCGTNCTAELLGARDVIRPWGTGEESVVESTPSWLVAEEARVALLDDEFAAALGRWPAIGAALLDRALQRARSLGVQRTFAQLRRLDERTLLYLFHVGERFGRVTPAGIAIHLPLTHERLASLVGAHRPSLTSALIGLERDGALIRDGRHDLVLTARAVDRVAELTDQPSRLAA